MEHSQTNELAPYTLKGPSKYHSSLTCEIVRARQILHFPEDGRL